MSDVNDEKWEKSEGLTPSERYLAALCTNSFLSLWSYPNVYNNKGVSEKNRTGKELCDLLVVFDNHIIIFSDKSCAMPNTGNPKLDWQRWYRRAIRQSANQISGAERWLASHPNRVFLDRFCSIPFPLDLPALENRIVHRIVVALGAGKRIEQHFGGNSRGSLMIYSWLEGDQHLNPENHGAPPFFCIGKVDPRLGYVHVFDDVTLDLVLRELDTISDFVRYLQMKEKFLLSKKYIIASGEEELLGLYLRAHPGSSDS
jgi:hypothetical protein